MFILKIILSFSICISFQLIWAEGAWAWGPGIHTVIACGVIEEAGQILPSIARIIQSFPLEYLYGSLAADFFVGKGLKNKKGHSHNWETGFAFLGEAKDDQEAAYAYGFLSHLTADVVAHNYFVPNLIHQASTWKRIGHLYWEARADYFVEPVYIKIARSVLKIEQLDCDKLLKLAVGKRLNTLKVRRRIFTQSVSLSDFFCTSHPVFFFVKNSRYQISDEYQAFMINISYRLVKDFLTHPDLSPCLLFDPIGSRNLRLAGRNRIVSKLFNIPRKILEFNVDKELLKV